MSGIEWHYDGSANCYVITAPGIGEVHRAETKFDRDLFIAVFKQRVMDLRERNACELSLLESETVCPCL